MFLFTGTPVRPDAGGVADVQEPRRRSCAVCLKPQEPKTVITDEEEVRDDL